MAWWAASTMVLFALMVTWSLATPLGAASDEPTHFIKAAAVARGEFLGQPATPGSSADARHQGRAVMTVLVPGAFAADSSLAHCYRHRPTRTAACAPPPGSSGRIVSTTTYVGRYPPLYYAIVGTPSLVWHSGAGIRLMRVLSCLASSLFLGLAFACAALWSKSRILIAGVALAATPMVIFLGSVVNPSGLEIATAIAVWTTGLALVLDRSSDPPPLLLVAFFGSSCVLELIRGLSPLWLALILVALVCLEPAGCRRLIRLRPVKIGAAVVVAGGVLATLYIVLAQATAITASGIPLSANATAMTVANLYVGRASFYVTQIVGVFGWLDNPAPLLVVLAIGAGIVGLAWLAFATATRRHSAVLVGVLIASVFVPMAIDIKNALQIHNDVWQSRYAMPLYVGVPLIAAAIAGRSRAIKPIPARRLIMAVAVVVAVSQFVCFFMALRRYVVGVKGTFNIFVHAPGDWSPPLPTVVCMVAAAVIAAIYGCMITGFDRHGPNGGDRMESTGPAAEAILEPADGRSPDRHLTQPSGP